MPARSWIIRIAGRLPVHLVVIGQIAFELGVAVAVLDPLGFHLGPRSTGEKCGSAQNGQSETKHWSPPLFRHLPIILDGRKSPVLGFPCKLQGRSTMRLCRTLFR